MNETNIKELEKQRDELDRKIKQYYKDEEAERIKRNEEKYVGKCYKVIENNSTEYYKILSGLTGNSHCYMHCMFFKLPIAPRFEPVLRMHYGSKYEYSFKGNIIEVEEMTVESHTYKIEDDEEFEEITIEEFETALQEFGQQLIELSREDFTMNGEYYKG